jgi:FAD/FMN-containing dehydrogenase
MLRYKSKRQLGKESKIASLMSLNASIFRKARISKKNAIALEACIQGDVVWPWDQAYDKDRKQFDPAYNEYPEVIVYCKTLDDIACCLQTAHGQGWTVTCRSGGHNTAGYSVLTGALTIDMSRYFNQVYVDPENQVAVVGSGTNFETLDAKLEEYDLHVPGGECPDVCVGGYAQGGGYGFTSRQYGMHLDNVVEARVMMLDTKGVPHLAVANESVNPELFWALRGGTGNNFGVLIDLTYRVHPAGNMWGFTIQWDNPDEMVQAMLMVQNRYAKGAPDELGFQGALMLLPSVKNPKQKVPSYLLSGIYNGTATKGQALITPLLQIGTAQSRRLQTYTGMFSELNKEIMPDPDLPPNYQGFPPEVKESRYIAQPIDDVGWRKIVDYFNQRPTWNVTNAVFFEYYGGAISRVPIDATAFIHRDAYIDIYVDSFWYDVNDQTQKSEAENWLDGYTSLLDAYSNRQRYQNYPRRNMANYQWAFWREAIYTLAPFREKCDPLGIFEFPMSAKLPPDANDPVYQNVKRADRKSRFPRARIVHDQAYEKHRKRISQNR